MTSENSNVSSLAEIEKSTGKNVARPHNQSSSMLPLALDQEQSEYEVFAIHPETEAERLVEWRKNRRAINPNKLVSLVR